MTSNSLLRPLRSALVAGALALCVGCGSVASEDSDAMPSVDASASTEDAMLPGVDAGPRTIELRSGRIGSLGGALEANSMRLRDHSLERDAYSCSPTRCLRGGIQP